MRKNDAKKQMIMFCILAGFGAALGCKSKTEWTDEQRKAFRTQCEQTATIDRLSVGFRGFADSDFTEVTVKVYDGKKLLDTFSLPVPPARDSWEKDNKVRSATIERTITINHAYEFIVPGQTPYKLDGMKMVMWPQYTMNSEGWGCRMADFALDGKRFTEGSPSINKRP